MYLVSSVNRFGKISPLWQNPQSQGYFFAGLFIICQNFEPTLANIECRWAIFHRQCKWPNVEK